MSGVSALYLYLLAGIAGYVLVARVPSILHTPIMSGSNFVHGIVLSGAMLALAGASSLAEQVIGFLAVAAAAANVVGGFVVTERMLALFIRDKPFQTRAAARAAMPPVADEKNKGQSKDGSS